MELITFSMPSRWSRPSQLLFLLAICACLSVVFQSQLHSKAASSFFGVEIYYYSSLDVPHEAAAAQNSDSRSKQHHSNDKPNTTTTTGMSEERQQRQPKVMLHIGPHKTGTTVIQHFLKEKNVIELLRQDNIVMPTFDDVPGPNPRFPEFNWGGCIAVINPRQRYKDFCQRKPLAYFANYTMATYAKGQDIIMVTEDLDNPKIVNMALLRKSLLPYTDIQIIVTYRRLHDWFKSWYVEIVRLYQENYYSRSEPFVSYTDWLEKHGNFDKFLNRHTLALEANYQRQSNVTVSVLHYHQNTSLLENFFCHVLKNRAPHTCQSILKYGGHNFKVSDKEARVTQVEAMEVCRLVWSAKNFEMPRGLRHCQYVAGVYLPLFQQHNISIRRDFPVLLPSQSMLETIWNQTVLAETKYFAALSASGGDGAEEAPQPTPEFWTNLRRDYDHAIATKWYSTNVDEMKRANLLERLLSSKGADESAAFARYCKENPGLCHGRRKKKTTRQASSLWPPPPA